MTGFPWLPIGTALPGGAASAQLLDGGSFWQICGTGGGGRVALLVRPGDGPEWWDAELEALRAVTALGETDGLLCLVMPAAARPRSVQDLAVRSPAVGQADAKLLGHALGALRRRNPGAAWTSALFLPEQHLVLATAMDPDENRRAVLVAALCGGVRDATLSPGRIATLNPRLDPATVAAVLDAATDGTGTAGGTPAPDGFVLPGQPAVQALLRERVLDLLHRPAEYARLGVPPPAGVLLAGPPGCGKSFAAARLAAFLGWPLHEISVAGVGSMWLHETSRRLHDAFQAAAAQAPAVVLMEELDALGKPRTGGFAPTVEEVNTLLRLVEGARTRGLLVVGTTNRLDAIDPALRRRGRFDHIVVMDYADEHGVAAMLRALLDGRPHAATLDIEGAARRLARRPASDAAWVVDEAARLAVRGGHDAIDDLLMARALQALAP